MYEKEKYQAAYLKTLESLKKFQKILFITTSNRWEGNKEEPKSTALAEKLAEEIGQDKVTLIDATKLKLYHCTGNVSLRQGNHCGVKDALLNDPEKNPSGFHRCWESFNNADDELWKVSKELFASEAVVFFGSIRWGQMNAYYQKLIERLTWIENRHATLGEENLLAKTATGIIITGQNWQGANVLAVQKAVLKFFGFDLKEELCWNWQYTNNPNDETLESYSAAVKAFEETFLE